MACHSPPLLSVIIPTISGRVGYLESSLMTCISQDVDNVEFVVSDNSTGDAAALVNSFSDPRIRYIRPDTHLPMSAHWSFALEHARGDSICIIGDDDGLMPNALRRINDILRDYGNIPLHHSFCNYFWPDHISQDCRNTIAFAHPEDGQLKIIETAVFLRGLYAGELRYVDGPMIYHNFIPKSVVASIATRGPFFRGAIPDVYSAVAIAGNVPTFLSVGEYLTISGQGAKANGANVLFAKDGPATLFAAYEKFNMFKFRFRSTVLQMLILESILEADKNFEMPVSINLINRSKFMQMAISQIRSMPNRKARNHEFFEIAKASIELGVAFKVPFRVLSHYICRASQELFGIPRTSSWPGVKSLTLPATVRNIYDASLALRTKLDGDKVAAVPARA